MEKLEDLLITAELRKWKRIKNWEGNYILNGLVYDDVKKRWPDGTRIWTTKITGTVIHPDCYIFNTRNSRYLCYNVNEVTDG